jgi:TATA-binding protein-associated factor Taf7
MSETIQMRTTQEQSGDYRVFATATVGGNQPVKGLAVHTDITSRLDSAEYVEAELAEGGAVALEADKATSATVRFQSAGSPAVRHVYITPEFLSQFGDFEFDGEDTDLDAVPSVGIESISPSSEDAYEQDKDERASAEDAADALVGESQDDADAEDSESDESEADDEQAVSDEEIGIVG